MTNLLLVFQGSQAVDMKRQVIEKADEIKPAIIKLMETWPLLDYILIEYDKSLFVCEAVRDPKDRTFLNEYTKTQVNYHPLRDRLYA